MNNNTRLFRLLIAAFIITGLQLPRAGTSQQAAQHLYPNLPGSNPSIFYPSCLDVLAGRADSLSLPCAQSIYTWQEPGQWDLEIYSTYRYLANAQIDTNINFYEPGGKPFNRVTYSWDFFNRLSGLTMEKYDSAWHNSSHFEYEFDEHGNPTTGLSYIWFSNDWQITTGSRNSYIYNDQSFVTEITREKYNILQYWAYDEKTEYIFGEDSVPAEIITYEWSATDWLPVRRTHSIDWKSYDGEHVSGQFYSFVEDVYNQGWISDFRQVFSYGMNGSCEYTEQDFRNDTWINDLKYEEIRDENSMLSEIKYSDWVAGQWVQFEGYRYTYNMDGIDLLEIVSESWDTITSAYINSERIVYSDFIHVQSIPENNLIRFTIFPNPAASEINIELSGAKADRITLTDLTGRIVLSREVHDVPSILKIDASACGPGIYIIIVYSGNKPIGIEKVIIY